MDFLSDIFKYKSDSTITGLTFELNIFYMLELQKKIDKNILVVASSLYEANKIYKSLRTYTDDVLLFPMDDFLTSVAIAISPELKITRLETLKSLNNGNNKIIITNLMGYLRYLPDNKKQDLLKIELKSNHTLNRSKLISILDQFGYNKTSLVTSTGEYALRGYIIDVFPIEEEHPIRIEFFGDDIDSIRYFDESTQLSSNTIKNIDVLPYKEISTKNKSSIYDYAKDPYVLFIDKPQIMASYNKLLEDINGYKEQEQVDSSIKYMFSLDEINPHDFININTYSDETIDKDTIRYQSKKIDNFNMDISLLNDFCNKYICEGYKVYLVLSKDRQIKEIKEKLNAPVAFIKKYINHGFIIDNYVVIGENDIEKTNVKEIKFKNSYKIGRKLKDYNQLEVGDYVIHTIHGIGIYNGIITLEQRGIKKDYLLINYQGNDKIYVPVEKIDTIFKYSGKDGATPVINKLNSSSWQKTKRNLQAKIKDISEELIKLYAARKSVKKIPYIDYPEEEVFANTFAYQETKDQLKAIKEIEEDLISGNPMDRLLCGDVGFGKTEVAFRAMFKTIINNEQVMYLCPTTILSNQQYASALERFKDYPIEIALLNRFTSAKEAKRIVDDFEKGKIDLLFGTHRLLSDDVKPKKLGLLVVDEEQRFGVTHKEKIKKLKDDVNVLTLSATPIPRTLKMSLAGLRDLSVIDTPPVNRYPVQTYVLSENEIIVRDAIYKELSRNGQVFVLYNNVSKINDKLLNLQKLVPEARIVVAHGQMNKSELESIMNDFIEGKYDVLLCTTIIETGIDIQNANTLIIYNADCFGLSQLYQIRGRVGRSDKIAYAYLLYQKDKMLNDAAMKRLQAIREFTELGSGYKLAMRDLSIRGAGDILGSEQAGFVDSVGISYYMKLIDEEMRRQKGEVIEEETDKPNLISVETHISDDYVSDEDLKIEIHQKINEIDSYSSLERIKNELTDRFGKVSSEIETYMYEEWFEKLAESINITKVTQNERLVELELPKELSETIKPDKLFMEAYSICSKFKFRYFNNKIYVSIPTKGLEKHFLYYLVPLLEKIKLFIQV